MKSLPDSERPWKNHTGSNPPPTLELHLSNGKQIALAWFIVTQFQMDSLKGKADRDPVVITISVGRASYGIAIFKENAQELWDDLKRRKVEFIRPIHPVIEIAKIRSTQPEEG